MKNISSKTMYRKFCAYGFLKNLQFFDPYMILFFQESGLNFLKIGILFAIREISTNILEIPSGIVADAVGRKKSMVISFLSYIASFLLFFFFPHFWTYAAAMFIFASGEAFRSGTHKAMIFEFLKRNNLIDQKIAYYGGTRSWAEIGSSISALIAIAIVFYTGTFRSVFLFSTVPYILDLFLILSYPDDLDNTESSSDGQRTIPSLKTVIRETVLSFKDLMYRKALLTSTFFDGIFESVKSYIQPILKIWILTIPLLTVLTADKRTAIITGIIYAVIYQTTAFASQNTLKKAERSGIDT